MNLTRLVALGVLDHGPRHGYDIRRQAELVAVDRWGGVSMQSLPRELRSLESEGLVEALREERQARRPTRTVYAITQAGRQELHILREHAVAEVHTASDTLAVALVFAGDTDFEELRPWLERRRHGLRGALAGATAEYRRLAAHGDLTRSQALAMRRTYLTMTADLAWHDDVLDHPISPDPPGALDDPLPTRRHDPTERADPDSGD